MIAPNVDTSQWPLCRISMPASPLSPAQFEQHLDSIEALFFRGEPFGLLIDARGGSPPSARQRQDIGRRMKRWAQRHPARMVGLALVLKSAIERGVFTAVSWASSKTFPMRAFALPGEAEGWLREQLRTGALSAAAGQ